MSTLPNILPTANVAAFPHREAAGFSGAPANPGEAFDQLMTRALAPVNPKNDLPVPSTLPTQTSAKDFSHLTNPATAATVVAHPNSASIVSDHLPTLDQAKTTTTKPAADHAKSAGNHVAADPTLIPQSNDKTMSIPLPAEIVAASASVSVETNPAATTQTKVASTTTNSGKSVNPTAGQISGQPGSPQKNSNAAGTPTVLLPKTTAVETIAGNHVAAKVADSIAKLSPTQTTPTQKSSPIPTAASPMTKDVSVAPVKASVSEIEQNPAAVNQPTVNSSKSSENKSFAVGQTSVPPVVTVVSSKAASVIETVAKTLPTNLPTTPASAAATAETIPSTPTNVNSPDATQTQTVASQSDLPETTDAETTSGVANASPVADVAANTVVANAVAAATETVTVPGTIPVAAANLSATNQSAEKNVSKVKTDNVAKTTTANTVATDVKTSTATNVTAKASATVDSKTTATSPAITPVTTQANDNSANSSSIDDSKTAKLAVKTTDDKSGDNFSQPTLFSGATQPAAGAKIAAPTQSADDGTSVAKQDGLGSIGEKANKTEGSTGKILPGGGAPMMRGNDLPVRTEQFTTAAATIAATQDSPATTTTAAVERMGNPAVDDLNLQTMERTHELVALHAMRLNETGASSLQLVIKPGAGTQLSLELRQRENGIEAQAVLQQGDFKHLNQHWPELQQRLEQRGIKLASLTDEGIANQNSGSSGNSLFEQKQNQSVDAFAGYASNGAATGTFTPVKTRVTTHEGWETWA